MIPYLKTVCTIFKGLSNHPSRLTNIKKHTKKIRLLQINDVEEVFDLMSCYAAYVVRTFLDGLPSISVK